MRQGVTNDHGQQRHAGGGGCEMMPIEPFDVLRARCFPMLHMCNICRIHTDAIDAMFNAEAAT